MGRNDLSLFYYVIKKSNKQDSTKEAAETMAKLASQFAVISPGMTVEKATDGLVSIMKANICLYVQKCA